MANKLMFLGASFAVLIFAVVLYFAFGGNLQVRTKQDCLDKGGEVLNGFPSSCVLDNETFLLDE